MFDRTLLAIRYKADTLELGVRPAACDTRRWAAAQRRALKEMRAAQRRRIAELQAEQEDALKPRWTDADLATLRRMWPDETKSRDDIAAALGRGKGAVSNKANKLGLGCRPKTVSRGSSVRKAAQILHAARNTKPRKPHKVPAPKRLVDRIGHARELLRRGIKLETVLSGFQFSAAEVAVLRETAR